MFRQLIHILLLLGCFNSLAAQTRGYDESIRLIKENLLSSDTARYNDKKVTAIHFNRNGNTRLIAAGTDTLDFNLAFLHSIQLDSGSVYNKNGLHLKDNTVLLFVEGTVEQVEFNEKDEVSVTSTVLPVYELKFSDAEKARAVADAFVQLRAHCQPDKDSFKPKRNK